jgi:hypothetical protein
MRLEGDVGERGGVWPECLNTIALSNPPPRPPLRPICWTAYLHVLCVCVSSSLLGSFVCVCRHVTQIEVYKKKKKEIKNVEFQPFRANR